MVLSYWYGNLSTEIVFVFKSISQYKSVLWNYCRNYIININILSVINCFYIMNVSQLIKTHMLFRMSICVLNIILPKQFLTSGYKSGQDIKKPYSKYIVCLFLNASFSFSITEITKHNLTFRKSTLWRNCPNFRGIEYQ